MNLLQKLFGFWPVQLGVIDGEGGPGEGEAGEGEGTEGGEGEGEGAEGAEEVGDEVSGEEGGDGIESVEETGDVPSPKAESMAAMRKRLAAESEARRKAEVEAAQERGRREAYEAQHRPAPAKEPELPADATDQEKWAFNTNKVLEESRRNSQHAVALAQDTADRAQFYSTTNPLIPKYKDRIEETLAQVRKAGGNASRDLIFKTLVGEDAIKNAGKAKPGKTDAQRRVEAARGKPQTVKSDASGSGKPSRVQQLEKKLENVRL